jgi:hypothetical protein
MNGLRLELLAKMRRTCVGLYASVAMLQLNTSCEFIKQLKAYTYVYREIPINYFIVCKSGKY